MAYWRDEHCLFDGRKMDVPRRSIDGTMKRRNGHSGKPGPRKESNLLLGVGMECGPCGHPWANVSQRQEVKTQLASQLAHPSISGCARPRRIGVLHSALLLGGPKAHTLTYGMHLFRDV